MFVYLLLPAYTLDALVVENTLHLHNAECYDLMALIRDESEYLIGAKGCSAWVMMVYAENAIKL